MRPSWLVLVVTLYVSLDLANPMMPGALVFGVENPVELRQAERFHGHDGAPPGAGGLPSGRIEPMLRRIAARRAPASDVPPAGRSAVPRTRSSLSTPASPSGDH